MTTQTNQMLIYRLSDGSNGDNLMLKKSTPQPSSVISSTMTIDGQRYHHNGNHHHMNSHNHNISVNNNKKRYLVSSKSGKVFEMIDRKPVAVNVSIVPIIPNTDVMGRPVVRPVASIVPSMAADVREPESDLISDDQFFKYLSLIDNKTLRSAPKSVINEWPLRGIARVDGGHKRHPTPTTTSAAGCPGSVGTVGSGISRRAAAKQKWLEEVKDNGQRLGQQNNPNDWQSFRDKRSKRLCDKTIREDKESLNLISNFDLSSFMGRKVFRTCFEPLNELEKYYSIYKIENLCLDQLSYHLLKNMSNFSQQFQQTVTRITRQGSDWSQRIQQHHSYCFTRRQRLEKWRRLETGLNWRSRLVRRHCRPLRVRLSRVLRCPVCSQSVDFYPRHQCWEFEEHLRPQPLPQSPLRLLLQTLPQQMPQISCSTHRKDSSHELIIIGDDFMDDFGEQEVIEQSNDQQLVTSSYRPTKVVNNEEVVKATDDDDEDDVMIIKEVVVQPIPKQPMSMLSTGLLRHKMSSHSLVNSRVGLYTQTLMPLKTCNHLRSPKMMTTNTNHCLNRNDNNNTNTVVSQFSFPFTRD